MACSDWSDYGEALKEGAFWDAILCRLAEPASVEIVSLFILSAVMLATYIVSGSIIIPLVLTIILSSLAYAFVPGIGVTVLAVVLILATPSLSYLIVMRLDRGA